MENVKKLILYAFVPAIIAGVFSISPKLYDIIAEPKAKLMYQFEKSSPLEVDGAYKSIIAIKVLNSGRKSLNEIKFSLNIPDGLIESYSLKNENALSIKEIEFVKDLSFIIESMLANESLDVSIMVGSKKKDSMPKISLRSKEVLGVFEEKTDKAKTKKLDLMGAILASIGVFLTVGAMIIALSAGRIPFAVVIYKQDILFFIVMRVKIADIQKLFMTKNGLTTYYRMGDLLLGYGLKGDNERESAIQAIKCMLLINLIAKISLNVLKNNLKLLEKEKYSEEIYNLIRKQAKRIKTHDTLRENIELLIDNPTIYLTNLE